MPRQRGPNGVVNECEGKQDYPETRTNALDEGKFEAVANHAVPHGHQSAGFWYPAQTVRAPSTGNSTPLMNSASSLPK